LAFAAWCSLQPMCSRIATITCREVPGHFICWHALCLAGTERPRFTIGYLEGADGRCLWHHLAHHFVSTFAHVLIALHVRQSERRRYWALFDVFPGGRREDPLPRRPYGFPLLLCLAATFSTITTAGGSQNVISRKWLSTQGELTGWALLTRRFLSICVSW